jgi:hypothetical protein
MFPTIHEAARCGARPSLRHEQPPASFSNPNEIKWRRASTHGHVLNVGGAHQLRDEFGRKALSDERAFGNTGDGWLDPKGCSALPNPRKGQRPSPVEIETARLVERFQDSNHMPCHPGARPKAASPGSITKVRGYGFRARRFAAPRNDQEGNDRFHGIAALEHFQEKPARAARPEGGNRFSVRKCDQRKKRDPIQFPRKLNGV